MMAYSLILSMGELIISTLNIIILTTAHKIILTCDLSLLSGNLSLLYQHTTQFIVSNFLTSEITHWGKHHSINVILSRTLTFVAFWKEVKQFFSQNKIFLSAKFSLFVCVEFFVPFESFSLIWRRHHYRWRAANFDHTWHLWPLSSEGSLACHNYCDTGHPFTMGISEDPWHSHLMSSFRPSAWGWRGRTL